jgi:hypothetical protein
MFCILTTRTSSKIVTNTTVLALRTMGSRYGRRIAQILARRTCLHAGGSRQIYQVGRGSPRNNPRFHSRDQLHQVYCFFASEYHIASSRTMGQTSHQKCLRATVKVWESNKIRIHSASKDKRTSRKS